MKYYGNSSYTMTYFSHNGFNIFMYNNYITVNKTIKYYKKITYIYDVTAVLFHCCAFSTYCDVTFNLDLKSKANAIFFYDITLCLFFVVDTLTKS